MNFRVRLLAFVIVTLVVLCGRQAVGQPQVLIQGALFQLSSGCDDSLWGHVYKPNRFQVISRCTAVSGIIAAARPEPDGDIHIRLTLDRQFQNLLNPRNVAGQHGDLVLEPICINNPTQPSVGTPCNGFTNRVLVPSAGTHVVVTGSYVQDNEPGHGWREIHPVTSIRVIP